MFGLPLWMGGIFVRDRAAYCSWSIVTLSQSHFAYLFNFPCASRDICITCRDNLILSFPHCFSNLRSLKDGAVKKTYPPKVLANQKSSALSGIRSEKPCATHPVQYPASHGWTRRNRLRELRIRWACKLSPACSGFSTVHYSWLKWGGDSYSPISICRRLWCLLFVAECSEEKDI